MSQLYELWHFRIQAEDEEDFDENEQSPRRLGVYSTEDNAIAAKLRATTVSDFSGFPDGFRIHTTEMGKDSWEEGFYTYYYPIEE